MAVKKKKLQNSN